MRDFDIDKLQSEKRDSFVPCMIVVQARMSSTRLPGKVMKKVLGRPLLFYLIERLRRIRFIEGICVVTSQNSADNVIVDFCKEHAVHCIRASEEDVLARYHIAAESFGLEAVVRITGDCPLIDPLLVEKAIGFFQTKYPTIDYLSNTLVRTFPRGMDFEVFRAEALKNAFFEAILPEEREHVTKFIIAHPERFHLANIRQASDDAKFRLTVDTAEDFELIRRLLEELYPQNPEFSLHDILQSLGRHPDWVELNAHVVQKTV